MLSYLLLDLRPIENSKDLYLLVRYEKIESGTHRAHQLDEQEYINGAIGHRMY